jgi:uncharacterized protein HemX
MIEQTKPEGNTDADETPKPVSNRETLPAVIALWGSLVTGVLGVIKATETQGIAAAACLVSAAVGFGVSYYIHSRKD